MTDPTPAPLFDRALATCLADSPDRLRRWGLPQPESPLPDLGPAARKARRAARAAARDELRALDLAGDPAAAVDRDVLLAELARLDWREQALASEGHDPLTWLAALGRGLSWDAASGADPDADDEAARRYFRGLADAPAFLSAARRHLDPSSRLHLDLALGMFEGLEATFDRGASHPAAPPDLEDRCDAARRALAELRTYLEDRRPDADPEAWRLGPARYDAALRHELQLDEPDQAAAAEATVARARARLEALAGPAVDPRDPQALRAALDGLDPPLGPDDDILEVTREAMAECRDFVASKGMLPPLTDDTLEVAATPDHLRGMASAYLDNTQIVDGQPSRYLVRVSPPPEGSDRDQRARHLAGFSRGLLRYLAAHEGFPGHFVQNSIGRLRASRVRMACGNMTYIEGWAVYMEHRLEAEGYRRGCRATEVGYWRIRLRIALAHLVDRGLHRGQLSTAEARELLRTTGLQDEGTVERSLHRARASFAQLSTYFLGGLELGRIADAWRAAHPAASEADLHAQLMDHGSVPLPVLRRALGLGRYPAA